MVMDEETFTGCAIMVDGKVPVPDEHGAPDHEEEVAQAHAFDCARRAR